MWLTCLLLAYPLVLLYQESLLPWVVPIVGLTTILGGFSSTATYTLERHMAVKKLIGVITAQAIQLAVTTIWAWYSSSLWALISGNLVVSADQVHLELPSSGAKKPLSVGT